MKSNKKILFMVNSLALGGGAEKFAVTLGNELSELGYEIYYLTFLDKNPKYEFKGEYLTFDENESRANKNVTLKIIDTIFKSFKVKKICKENNIDIIISIEHHVNFHAILSKYLFNNKSKIIATHHGDPEHFIGLKISFNAIKYLYPIADKVICVSKTMEETFKEKYGIRKNIQTIYNMLDLKECLELSNAKIPDKYKKIFDTGFIFINIGRLDIQKGQFYLIRCFKKVVEKYKDAKLCILGDATITDIDVKYKLEKLIENLGLKNNIFLLGSQNNIFSFLKRNNCFIMSSLYEGFPITLIEALSTEIPIISTDCRTGPRESLCPELNISNKIDYPYFGKYGILTEPFDIKLVFKTIDEKPLNKAEKMLADLMIEMIEDPNLRKTYSNGIKRAEDFDKSKIMKKWKEIIIN